MEIVFPHVEDILIQDGDVVFDVLADGERIECIVTALALSTIIIDTGSIMPRIEAFKLGQHTIQDVIKNILYRHKPNSILVNSLELESYYRR